MGELGRWIRVSAGWRKLGPAHWVPDRRSPTGAWSGHGILAACGANVYRRSNFDTVRLIEKPDEHVCQKCERVLRKTEATS